MADNHPTPDNPTADERRTALIIFGIIIVLGLVLTLYFLGEATEEMEEADLPEEGEVVGDQGNQQENAGELHMGPTAYDQHLA